MPARPLCNPRRGKVSDLQEVRAVGTFIYHTSSSSSDHRAGGPHLFVHFSGGAASCISGVLR